MMHFNEETGEGREEDRRQTGEKEGVATGQGEKAEGRQKKRGGEKQEGEVGREEGERPEGEKPMSRKVGQLRSHRPHRVDAYRHSLGGSGVTVLHLEKKSTCHTYDHYSTLVAHGGLRTRRCAYQVSEGMQMSGS